MDSARKDASSPRALSRKLVSPLLAVLCLAVSLTGLLMLLDLAPDSLAEAHEWLGVVFVAAAAFHLFLNGRVLLNNLRSPPAILVAVAGVLFCAVLLVATSSEGDDDDDEERRESGGSDDCAEEGRRECRDD